LVGEQRQKALEKDEPGPGDAEQRLRAVGDVGEPLRAHGREGVRQPGAPPLGGGHRGHVPERAHRRRCVRHAQERLDGLLRQQHAPQRTVLGVHHAGRVLVHGQGQRGGARRRGGVQQRGHPHEQHEGQVIGPTAAARRRMRHGSAHQRRRRARGSRRRRAAAHPMAAQPRSVAPPACRRSAASALTPGAGLASGARPGAGARAGEGGGGGEGAAGAAAGTRGAEGGGRRGRLRRQRQETHPAWKPAAHGATPSRHLGNTAFPATTQHTH